jgi:hypothetical protein
MKSPDRERLKTIAAYWHSDVRTGDNRGFGIVVREGTPLVAAAVQTRLEGFALQPPNAASRGAGGSANTDRLP